MKSALVILISIISLLANAEILNVAVIGCGYRGGFDLDNMLKAGKTVGIEVVPVAFCDYYDVSARRFAQKYNKDAKCFSGAAGYHKVMKMQEVDAVILATPPSFRPIHALDAAKAKKHIFEEKPVAVDPIGVRTHILACDIAKSNGLTVVAGTQRRHDMRYIRQKQLIQSGNIGKIISGKICWNTRNSYDFDEYPNFKRYKDIRNGIFGDGELNKNHLISNWYYYEEMSGDHIVEQHVHNIDVANWFIGRYPVAATGFGGKKQRRDGNIYDFFYVDYDYGNGVTIRSECRQIDGYETKVEEMFRTDRNAIVYGGKNIIANDTIQQYNGDAAYVDGQFQECTDFILSVSEKGPHFMDGYDVTMSTATAIIGRISAKTGKTVKMSDILFDEKSEFYNMNSHIQPKDFEQLDCRWIEYGIHTDIQEQNTDDTTNLIRNSKEIFNSIINNLN